MSIITVTQQASAGEIIAEMDRRGDVMGRLQFEVDRLTDALESIDAVACDFGHYETAARTMKEIATEALGYRK